MDGGALFNTAAIGLWFKAIADEGDIRYFSTANFGQLKARRRVNDFNRLRRC
jgi:hypothetical protein